MRKFAIVIILALLSGCAHQDEWTTRDTWLQIGVTATLAADAYTTSKIQYDPWIEEVGPIAKHVLGRQPSTSDTYMYFGTLAISNYFITRALPAKWRPYWQGYEIAVHGSVAIKNCKLDLGC